MTERILTDPSDTNNVRKLHGMGAHLVLCAPDKRPLSTGWQRGKGASLADALHHVQRGGLVGFIPGKSSLWVCDVDDADQDLDAAAAAVAKCLKVRAVEKVPTRKGLHLYFRKHPEETEIRNRKWKLPGHGSGDVRGDKGFVIAWDLGAAVSAVRAVQDGHGRAAKSAALPGAVKLAGPEGVRAAKRGERNDTLNRNVYQDARRGVVDIAAYRGAALSAGLRRHETEPTLQSAIEAGARDWKPQDEISLASAWREAFPEFAYNGDRKGWVRYQSGIWRENADLDARRTMEALIDQTQAPKRLRRFMAARAALSFGEGRAAVYQRDFDADPWLAGLPDGKALVLGPRPEDVAVREATPEDRLTRCLGMLPASGRPERFFSFLRETWPDVDPAFGTYLWRFLGYCLTGETREHKFLFLTGTPGTGKSTLLEVLAGVLGSYHRTIAATHLVGRGNDHRQWLARLDGARLATVTELPERGGWRTEELSGLISGDPVEANFMRANSFEFRPACKVLIAGNHRPPASATSGLWRRMVLAECFHKPDSPERGLGARMLRTEGPQILNWMLDGLRAWLADGLGSRPATVSAAIDEYQRDADPLATFLAEHAERRETDAAVFSALIKRFNEWLKEHGARSWTPYRLSRELKSRGYTTGRAFLDGKQSRVIYGLRIT